MTKLYEAIKHKLWRKDIIHIEKEAQSKRLTEEIVKTILFNGLVENQIEFTLHQLETCNKLFQQHDTAARLS